MTLQTSYCRRPFPAGRPISEETLQALTSFLHGTPEGEVNMLEVSTNTCLRSQITSGNSSRGRLGRWCTEA